MNRQHRREKGDGTLLPERPEGCFAQKSPVPFFVGPLSRREFLKAAAGAGAALTLSGCLPPAVSDGGLSAAVAILRAGYDQALVNVIEAGFSLVPPPDVLNKRVLLKVNLVDLPRENKPIVTNPAAIVAAAEAFRRRGAAEVIVADGPALQRDAWQIVDAVGLTPLLGERKLQFIDLNTAEPIRVPNALGQVGLDHLYVARPAWEADVVVSVPKMKVHHWLGVSLAMKNMFGVMSGVVYGAPRNVFHVRDPEAAVLDFNHTRPIDYAIVDGIIGLEGDGPVRGTAVDVGVLVMGSNALAVDATAARVMCIDPQRVGYLRRAAGDLGPITEAGIEQRGETIASVRRPFAVLPHQASIQMS